PSAAMREYLAEIYRLQEDSPMVSTTSLAERLNVSAPAIPRMLKRLRNAGYVKHIPYQGFELTELGRQEALRELRRHRIMEVFLVDVMGFTWDETHELAEDLSKGINDVITERMAEMTNQPTRCPHGEPIPDPEGKLPELADTCIINLTVGHKGTVSRVRTNEPERLKYFAELGLVPGAEFEIVGRAPFNGPMRLRVGRDDVVLGVELTKSLWVT
ncbi:MAG TPA: metal-dependent transcriptional regulator, partial [Anaerolineae bacterium]|nr:metal-dependent transcriptional regulator [Anaerolineae bacterium]